MSSPAPTNHQQPATTAQRARSPISCHVLDTSVGLPAAGINCALSITVSRQTSTSAPVVLTFVGVTNEDGRIANWNNVVFEVPRPDYDPVTEAIVMAERDPLLARIPCELTFAVEEYFTARGVESFFPRVTVNFVVSRTGEPGSRSGHWHVPLLLSPFSYSTYRGS